MIVIEYDGEPVGKGRPRFNTKTGHAYTPQKTRDEEARIAEYARYQNVGVEFPLEGELSVTLSFWSKRGSDNPAGRVDIDNITKLCLDALNAVVWKDDWQVSEIHAYLFRGADEARTSIVIRQASEQEAHT